MLGITAGGTLGYVVVEGMRPLDALYMTVITLSTVGYGEVQPLSDAGRLFTIALIVLAGGTALYLMTQIAQIVLETNLRATLARRTMQRTIDQLSDHVIVCGFGRFGRIVADELRRGRRAVAIVEPEAERQPDLERSGLPYVIGSATDDAVLRQAGVERAAALVAATGSDATNVFITLAARELKPGIGVHARGETDAALRRLRAAGADQVVSAYQMGGQRMAMSILRPSVVDFLEIARPLMGEGIDLEEVRIEGGARVIGRTLREIEGELLRLRVVAVRTAAGEILLAPDPSRAVDGGDQLVVVGERSALERLAQGAA